MNDKLIKIIEKQKAQEIEPHLVFNCGAEILRLDKDGMTYNGHLIKDGGEAHKAFLEVMSLMKNELK